MSSRLPPLTTRITVLLAAMLLAACQQAANPTAADCVPDITRHATLLQMHELEGGGTLVRIHNPWQRGQLLTEYLLLPADDTVRARLAAGTGTQVIRTPLERSTVCASCHYYLLEQFGALDAVAAVCDADYTELPSLHGRLADGQLRDAGNATMPNLEVIMEARSDAIWISPFENAGTGHLALTRVPVVYCADYMEPHPLARAEWMRFYGRLVGRTRQADSLFTIVERDYLAAATPDSAPHVRTLLTDLPVGSVWYVPGGQSTMGRMYQDAGFVYPWAADDHAGSLSLSPEAVTERGLACDVWLFKYYDRSKTRWTRADLLEHHPLARHFKAVRCRQLYGCNTARSRYFDETPFRPDLLLASLRAIATGTPLPDSIMPYFELLDE